MYVIIQYLHIRCACAFDMKKYIHARYKDRDCMNIFCKDLKKWVMKMANHEKSK